LSRNIATIKVAERTGFENVASLWRKTKVGKTALQGYPSIALGVFELTPLDVATAYSAFANGGVIKIPHGIARIRSGNETITPKSVDGPRIAREDTTFLVTNMMRSVINEGTGAGARANGF